MSSNKTIIPGMEDAYKEQPSSFGSQNANAQDETYVPNPFGAMPNSVNMPNQKPVVWFLVLHFQIQFWGILAASYGVKLHWPLCGL